MTETASVLTDRDRDDLREIFGARVAFDEPLAPHTSWKIGGPADAFAHVESEAELEALFRFLLRRKFGFFVLGNGSNLLVGDGGLRGITVRLCGEFSEIAAAIEDDQVVVRAGGSASLAQLAGAAASHGALGVDTLVGIPGTLGGAIRMNAGTAKETGDFLREVTVATPSRPKAHVVSPTYTYRSSTISRDAIVVRAVLAFDRGDPAVVRASLHDRLVRRKATQPLSMPNAGSCFRNPPNDRAGRLIEAAGAKGRKIGGAIVSDVHANFIVNDGTATAEDVACLLTDVRRDVEAQFGVTLEYEVHFVGVFTAVTSAV